MAGASSFVLNADDYGMDAGVDLAIRLLAERGIVTSTSVMTLGARWPEAARGLLDAPLDRGLHLDLTSPFAAGRHGLGGLMAAAYARRLDRTALRRVIDLQLDRFETALQAPPDFVDGHQHVHQLPGVRDEVIAALAARYGAAASRVRLRSCWSRRWRGVKAAVIAASGAWGLMRLARTHGFAFNSDFAGVYDFSPAAPLAALWRGWLGGMMGPEPLAMCHVGVDADGPYGDDPIRLARVREFEWFSSAGFGELCEQLGVLPGRAPR
jgi:predicted glycoside hydrolase/deacetylase ChbG (UPF0249 family)